MLSRIQAATIGKPLLAKVQREHECASIITFECELLTLRKRRRSVAKCVWRVRPLRPWSCATYVDLECLYNSSTALLYFVVELQGCEDRHSSSSRCRSAFFVRQRVTWHVIAFVSIGAAYFIREGSFCRLGTLGFLQAALGKSRFFNLCG